MPSGTKQWSTIKLIIQDRLRNQTYASDYPSELLRSFNSALRDINNGKIGDRQVIEVGYGFQKETVDISYVDGTTDYLFSSISVDEETFKFPNDLRVDTNEDVEFTYRKPEHFFRKIQVYGSSERIYAIQKDAGTWTLKIKHYVTETLNFEYFTTDLVLNGSTRQAEVENDTDKLLIPDRFLDVAIDLCVAEVFGQTKGWIDEEHKDFLDKGRTGLRVMINSIGVLSKQPVDSYKIKGQWGGQLIRKLSSD